MKKIVLKFSEAENVLREWFEAGIAFNLIFGCLDTRKKSGLVHLRRLLANIPLALRPHYYDILEKAFSPRHNILDILLRYNDVSLSLRGQLYAYTDCLANNYPKMPLKLLLTAAATTHSVLEPKKIIHAYYKVRKELVSNNRHKLDITIEDPTLIALCKMVSERQLTSNLVDIDYGDPQGKMTPFRIHAFDLFTNKGCNKLVDKEFSLGQVHGHFIKIAHKLALGLDPLNEVSHPLLKGKKCAQWAPILHAVCRNYENKTEAEYFKTYCQKIPEGYIHELSSKSINHQIKKLNERANSLFRFLNPSPDDFAQRQPNVLNSTPPEMMQKMIVYHMIMFYFSLMKNSDWYIKVRNFMKNLKMSHPLDYESKFLSFSISDECINDTLYTSFNEIFSSNPVGLFPWMFSGVLPEPMELMTHYFSNKNKKDIEDINERNKFFKNLHLAESALIIPRYLNGLDNAQGRNTSIMVQLPSCNSETCVFYTATGTSKEDGLYLAQLFSNGLYIQKSLEESLKIELKEIEDLLLGICFLWHETFVDKISLMKFVDILQDNEINDISERTLKARKDKAKNWLMQWPNQCPLIA
ncbi:hypothetical protein E1914_23195 [Salmonella enterica subsp. enterica serovar Chester]|nr:hypothetical protein [Salmonella enterica subsp. enterica serovar Agama]EBV2696089.1 hypothetical protein [Salmonella enterica subsp. enterica serovar Poona]EBW2517918.1 hypothetical protein [Salmonella enterica subsp. enterica serovar Poona]ECF2495854.1 hypothetical protein [Salmonella enterica subsp. enterica serovar Chester]ECG3131668.1 hypothetical protein [Salmonella enterica subsp. enterica serovar Poona]